VAPFLLFIQSSPHSQPCAAYSFTLNTEVAISSKRRSLSVTLHGVTRHKIVVFVVTAVTNSNQIYLTFKVLDHDKVQFCTGITNFIPYNTVLNAKTITHLKEIYELPVRNCRYIDYHDLVVYDFRHFFRNNSG
jgi:hypothetical protein